MDINKLLIRSSMFGKLTTKPKDKSEKIAVTAQNELLKYYYSIKYNRYEQIKSKYLEKGTGVEEYSLTRYSVYKNVFFKKNSIRLNNEYITGEPDIYIGDSIENAEETLDIKSSWSLNTFIESKYAKLNTDYEWQGHCYMYLTGALKHTIVYVLENTPLDIIDRELYNLSFKYENGDIPEKKQYEVIRNHIFDLKTYKEFLMFKDLPMDEKFIEIPENERIHEKSFYRDEEKIKFIGETVKNARTWLMSKI